MIFLTSLIYETYTSSLPLTKQYEDEKTTEKTIVIKPSNQNKTISDLVKEQAETIKKIVSSQKQSQIDYPTVTRREPDIKMDSNIKEKKERESIEQLRLKCQHLFKLMNKNEDGASTIQTTAAIESTTPFATIIPFGPAIKPEFLKNKSKPTTQNLDNVYIFESTSPQQELTNNDNLAVESTQQNPIVIKPFLNEDSNNNYNNVQGLSYSYPTNGPNGQEVKYIKLEPVILQRMLLSNGQNYFYWYRTVPNYMKYAEPAQYNQQLNSVQDHNTQLIYDYPLPVTATPRNVPTTTRGKQTTQTLPQTTTTVPTTTTTTQQTVAPDNSYKHEFKFVVPYSFTGKQSLHASQQFDPYAYYPKYLQPNTMNVQVPYMPTFNMIKTLNIPKIDENLSYNDGEKLS